MIGRPSPAPYLEISSHGFSLRGVIVLVAFSFPALAVLGFVLWLEVAAEHGWPPVRGDVLPFFVLGWFLASIALAGVTIRWGERYVGAREGDVAFSESGVLVRKPGRGWRLFPWEEIASYDDGAAEFVQLEVRGARGAWESAAALPTRDADVRAVVLGELDRRGLVRREV